MKKLILLVIPLLFLCGCAPKNLKDIEVNEDRNFKAQFMDIITYCDKKYGIEYLIFTAEYKGGISVRLDENGNVIHCK